jgi:hypothetical protein
MWQRFHADPPLCVSFCMWGVGAFVRAILLGTTMGSVCVSTASAGPAIDDRKTILFFSGADFWRHGSFSHGGLLWSPGGLDREGFTLKLLLGSGRYHYTSGALADAAVLGEQIIAFALPGWRFQKDRLTVSVFAGVDIQQHRLTPDDPSNSLRGTKTGIRGGFDLWFEPNALTMLGADASLSSVGPSYSARLAAGWRFADSFYAGPEIGGFADGESYQQFRVGLHITGLKTHDLEWSAALGWAFDSDERDSPYGRLGICIRR